MLYYHCYFLLLFIFNLTPCIPLSFKGEGEGFIKRGFAPLKHPIKLGSLAREGNFSGAMPLQTTP